MRSNPRAGGADSPYAVDETPVFPFPSFPGIFPGDNGFPYAAAAKSRTSLLGFRQYTYLRDLLIIPETDRYLRMIRLFDETGDDAANGITAMKPPNSDAIALTVPPAWDWCYQKLQEFRECLMEESASQAEEAVQPIERHSMDMADSATDEFDHNMALGILSYQQESINEVDAAIQRIFDGTYGICEKSGKQIPLERLMAVPWTRYTKDALERMEHKRSVKHPHLREVASLRDDIPSGLAEAPEPGNDELFGHEVAKRRRNESIRNLTGGSGFSPDSIPLREP